MRVLPHALDPRLKILLVLVAGVCTWQAGVWGLVVYLLAAVVLLASLPQRGRVVRGVRGYVWFLGFWGALVVALGLWEGHPWTVVVVDAGVLVMRLAVLVGLGLWLAVGSSSRELGLALSWGLRPVLRHSAWQVALAMALMVHYIPAAFETAGAVSHALRVRRMQPGFVARVRLVPVAVVRTLGARTIDQATAIAARRLDRPEAWRYERTAQAGELLATLGALTVCVGLALC